MSKIYKTARGKSIDIDKIKLANENTIAVGNMKVNARGDLLGSGGQIAAGRNQIMNQVYAVEEAPYSPTDTAPPVSTGSASAKKLHELANALAVPVNPETIKAPVPAAPAARGSLASAVAKTATIKQEPIKNPAKSTGPTRI